MKDRKDYFENNPYDEDDGFIDYGQDTTPEDPFYADWSTDEYAPNESEESKARYYEAKDRYYAERDAYYAERDAYYAQLRAQDKMEEEELTRRDYYRSEEKRSRENENRRARRRASFSYEEENDSSHSRGGKHRRKHHFFRNLLILLLLAAMGLLLWGQMPCRNAAGLERLPGKSNILLVGLDADGQRTDTLMLLSLDKSANSIRLLSIPRDTYIPFYETPKINSAYGAGGGGERGLEELMRAVETVTGFMPDAYLAIGVDAFVEAVNTLGGIDFDVPMDMHYDDPDQNLHIHLSAGYQHLDGYQAMGLVRFRSGYADADIGRTSVQRNFLRAAAKQWLTVSQLENAQELWNIYQQKVQTDLTPRNLVWLLRFALKADFSSMSTEVLTGFSSMVNDVSCYILEEAAVSEILKNYNPYI